MHIFDPYEHSDRLWEDSKVSFFREFKVWLTLQEFVNKFMNVNEFEAWNLPKLSFWLNIKGNFRAIINSLS